MKVVTILIPSFHGLRSERWAYKLGPTDEKKKRLRFKSLALLKQARLIKSEILLCCLEIGELKYLWEVSVGVPSWELE